MSLAKNIKTGEIVHGYELKAIEQDIVETSFFECPYELCKIKATPCSYKKENKKSSYFKYADEHLERCGLSSKQGGKGQKKKESPNANNSPPTPYISKLNLFSTQRLAVTIRKKHNEESKEKTNTPRAASSSLKPIIDYYKNNTEEAKNQYLSIPSIGNKKYKEWFQRVKNEKGIKYIKPCIFFGVLFSFTKLIINKDGIARVKFLDRNIKNAITLEIDTNNWKCGEISVFKAEFNIIQKQAESYYEKRKASKEPALKYLSIYFLGFIKSERTLTTNSFKLIDFSFEEKICLPSTNCGYTINHQTESTNQRAHLALTLPEEKHTEKKEEHKAETPPLDKPYEELKKLRKNSFFYVIMQRLKRLFYKK